MLGWFYATLVINYICADNLDISDTWLWEGMK
jgi:hypothetical protein